MKSNCFAKLTPSRFCPCGQKRLEERSDERSSGYMLAEEWHVYMLRCRDGKLYVGIAKNVQERVSLHNKGLACRFTKYRHPVELLFQEKQSTYALARKRESEIKGFSQKKKFALIKNDLDPSALR